MAEDQALADRAGRLLAAGRPAEAAAALRRAVALAPERADHRRALAEALAASGDGLAAAEACADLLAHRPDCPTTRVAVARAMAAIGQGAEALLHYREALMLRPADAEARLAMAGLMIDRGDLRRGIDEAQRCLRDRPEWAEAHYQIGRAWAELGERDQAEARFRHCLDLAPDDALGAARALAGVAGQAADALPAAFIRCLFDQYADSFDEELTIRLRYTGPKLVADALARLLPAGAGPVDAIDLGCGTGLLGPHIRPLARKLAGVDLSPAMVAKARGRGIYDALSVGDAVAALAAAPGAWDVALAADVLVYLGDLGPVCAAAAAALKPGGLLIATVERSPEPGFVLMPTRRFRHHPDHIRAAAAAAGLAVVALEPVVPRHESNLPVDGLLFALRR